MDPLAEKHPEWTPYNYVLNNPLVLVDPDGMQELANEQAPEGRCLRCHDRAPETPEMAAQRSASTAYHWNLVCREERDWAKGTSAGLRGATN